MVLRGPEGCAAPRPQFDRSGRASSSRRSRRRGCRRGRWPVCAAGSCAVCVCLLNPFSDIQQCEEMEVVVEVVEPGRWWHFLEQPTLHQLIASWSLPAPLPTATARTLSSSSYWHHIRIISSSYCHHIVIIAA